MSSRVFVLVMLFALALRCPVSLAQDDSQYRRIELIDGSVLYVKIIATDAETLRVNSRKGEMIIPWMDVIDLVEISPAEYDENVTLRIAYVATVSSDPGLRPTADAVGARFQDAVEEAPKLNLLRAPTLEATLSPAARAALRTCPPSEVDCVVDATQEANLGGYLFGTVEPIRDQVRATFTYVELGDSTARREISVPFKRGELPAQSSLITAVWHLLELDEASKPVMTQNEPAGTVAEGPAQTPEQPPANAPAPTQPRASNASQNTGTTVQGRFIPLPGAPALYSHENNKVAVASGVTALLTGTAVYVVGGAGMKVPWDEQEAGWADPLFLSSVGVVTYVASSIIINQIIVKTMHPRGAARFEMQPSSSGLTVRF